MKIWSCDYPLTVCTFLLFLIVFGLAYYTVAMLFVSVFFDVEVSIMKRGFIFSACVLAVTAQISLAAQWYVSLDGKPSNPGTREAPWDITSALDGRQKVPAGDNLKQTLYDY